MNRPPFAIGIDLHPEGIKAVRVRTDDPRPSVVDALLLSTPDSAPTGFWDDAQVVLAIPDDKVIVKNIAADCNRPSRRERALFEMTRSLTAKETEYLVDILPTPQPTLALGTAVRRSVLETDVLQPYRAPLGTINIHRATSRGIGLAGAYLDYCIPAGNGLAVLIDAAAPDVSIALVNNRQIVGLAILPGETRTASEHDPEKLAVDIRTTINLRLSSLFTHGITLPPTAVLLVGKPDNTLKTALEPFFPVPISHPELNTGYLDAGLRECPDRMDGFLVPLGLTAKSLA